MSRYPIGHSVSICLFGVFVAIFAATSALAQDVDSSEQRTTVTVKRERAKGGAELPVTGHTNQPDFEIIDGSGDVLGEPGLGRKAGYDNWKAACEKWKDEISRRNQGQHMISVECGSPAYTIETVQYTFRSTGSFKMRVRTHAGSKGEEALPAKPTE